jgi:hypothetical protein
MRTRAPDRSALGSTLLLVMILLGVLAAIGAAAVTMASRDRINASAKTRRDMIVACAQAAQAKVWAEVARYGPRWFGSDASAVEFSLADGTRLGPLHYDQNPGVLVKNVMPVISKSCGTDGFAQDLTNTTNGLMPTCNTVSALARCTIPSRMTGGPDSQLEVEFVIRTRL